MPTPTPAVSDAGRHPPSSAKPKKKGKSTTPISNGSTHENGGAFSDNAKFSDSTTRSNLPVVSLKKTKSKPNAKPKKNKKHTTSFFDRIVQLILLGFILFTIHQCHYDTDLKSPVCQAVHQRILQPLVVKPYNRFITHPSVAPAIQASKPYYAQAVRASQPLVRVVHRIYVMRVAPHLARLEKKARPYVRNLEFHYSRSVAPHVQTAQIYYTRFQRALEPYVNQAIAALLHLWFEIQPKLIPLIEESKFIPDWVREHALIPFLRLREQYVDTHVYKMLEKVEEFGESRDTKSLKAENHITRLATTTNVASSTFQASTSETDPVHSITPTPAPETIEIEPTVISITPAAITPNGPIIPDAPSPSATPTPSVTSEEDVDAWLESLRADSTSTPAAPEPESQPERQETEEEVAERIRLKAIATAEKRADIEQRHTKYEEDLKALGQSAVDDLAVFLSALRSVAAADLKRRSREHIATLQNEAEKGLKGTEAYLQKLKGAAQGGAIKIALFDDVVTKVEKRFLDTAQNVSQTISSWWSDMHEEEQKEANTAAEAIKALAHEGQANIGMDYAWLDDVTVADWTRYHSLVDTADAFAKELQDLVDGTHANSEPNPLEKGLGGLQTELNVIIDDFQSKLKVLHQNGLRSFGNVNPESPESDEAPSTSSILPGAEARSDSSPGILQRGKDEVEAAIKRAEAEAGTVAENVQAIFQDGVKQAGDAVHQATRTAVKAAGGTPTPETFQETIEYAGAKVSEAAADASASARAGFDDAAAKYEKLASHASQVVHDATRSVVSAAGYTPEPETPKEHAESMIAEASSTIVSMATAVSSVLDDTASSAANVYSAASVSVASAYSDAAASAHQATRSLSRAAGYTPTPETPGEHVESLAAVVGSSASSVVSAASSVYNEATRTVIKAMGGTPSPTNVYETAESLAADAQAYYADAAAKLPSYEGLRNRANSLVDRSKTLFGAEPAPSGYEKLLNDALALIDEYQSELASRAHLATRAASRAVGATPTPEGFGEHVESIANRISTAVSSATEAVRSVVHEDL